MEKTHKTKEGISYLPKKEFRVIILKIIRNLSIKMEAQINRMEAWIENTHTHNVLKRPRRNKEQQKISIEQHNN